MGNQPHVLVIPFPAQGHVMPLMKLSCCLVDRGFKVTFVNTEFVHARVIAALPEKVNVLDQIDLVSIPDGVTGEDRDDHCKLLDSISNTMPGKLEKLIRNIGETIACVIADTSVGWALELAKNMGIRTAAFFPACAGAQALSLSIPKLIQADVIDSNGTPKKNMTITLSPSMPTVNTADFLWNSFGNLSLQHKVFHSILRYNEISKLADWFVCNSFNELEPAGINLVPNLLPIGPLLPSNQLGHLWREDSTCLNWLSQQAPGSVIYVAFGSFTIFNENQFHELALGLQLLGRPFLWVVRLDVTGGLGPTYPDGFQDRVAHLGKIVDWAPQQKVLAHPSIACFLTHCGWNSTIEGVSMGVPLICWPYFADQFFNRSYITDVWRVGLELNPDETEIVRRDEIKEKVDQLLGDKVMKENSLRLKDMAIHSVAKDGSSWKNMEKFVEGMIS
ncbi:hypothetical protein GIB67_000713 [Kingdonia uniflora]|uniref:Glycosyltransferase n=1 Tax=Kingdonia uniflora TaxID=39325 RepID=A0A7J7ND03_9MAGN|nr:hypothetical protein GIB67_000713 [Kingdonia uniflora]